VGRTGGKVAGDRVTDVFDTNRLFTDDSVLAVDGSGLVVDAENTLSYPQLRDSPLSQCRELCRLALRDSPVSSCRELHRLASAVATVISAVICRNLSTASTDFC